VAGWVVATKVVIGCVVEAKVVVGWVVAGKVVAGWVVAGKVVLGCVVEARVVAGWVVAGKVVAGWVVAGKVVAGCVVAGKVVLGCVVEARVVAGWVVAGLVVAGWVVAGDSRVKFAFAKSDEFFSVTAQTYIVRVPYLLFTVVNTSCIWITPFMSGLPDCIGALSVSVSNLYSYSKIGYPLGVLATFIYSTPSEILIFVINGVLGLPYGVTYNTYPAEILV
jgi:hypothetical protein